LSRAGLAAAHRRLPRRPEGPQSFTWPYGSIKHEAVPDCGSFEVRFGDGRASKFFYWDDLPSRRLRPEILTSVVALMQAKAFARAMSDKDDDR